MSSLLAIAQLLLSPLLVILSSCGIDGTNYVSRIVDNGHDLLYSRAHAKNDVARFECRASDSGTCHYTLYPAACAGKSSCKLAPIQRFTVARGESRQIRGLGDFSVCVGTDDAVLGADCEPAAKVATR